MTLLKQMNADKDISASFGSVRIMTISVICVPFP